MTHQPNWFTAAVLSTVLGAFCFLSDQDYRDEFGRADELRAIQQEESARASREFAGQAVCGPGALAQWVDDKTLTCTPRRGQTYTVAGGTK
jgi:hypothetical protein